MTPACTGGSAPSGACPSCGVSVGQQCWVRGLVPLMGNGLVKSPWPLPWDKRRCQLPSGHPRALLPPVML